MRPKNRYEKIISEIHIRLIESKKGIRTMHTEITGDFADFTEIANLLLENKKECAKTIMLIMTLGSFLEEELEKEKLV